MKIQHLQLGYWYPLTTLHISEIQDFFTARSGMSHLQSSHLRLLRGKLNIISSELKLGELEYVEMHAASNITVKVFEDGLVTLTNDHNALKADIAELTSYFEDCYMPAIRYLFSSGAPSPKELASIEHEFPCFIVASDCKRDDAEKILQELGQKLEFVMNTKDVEIFRGGEIFVLAVKPHFKGVEELIETCIYFKEFKSQLHHYLNLHRSIWSQIEVIKEEKFIRGRDVKRQRTQLESFKKTIELIEARIGQMDLYMGSRSKAATDRGWDEYLAEVLQYRYTNLEHTHDYVRSLWLMTKQYVDSAIAVVAEINTLSTKTSVQALTVISSIGVVAGIMNYISLTKLPQPSQTGLIYFVVLLAGALLLNQAIVLIYGLIRYKVNAVEIAHNLHHFRRTKPRE